MDWYDYNPSYPLVPGYRLQIAESPYHCGCAGGSNSYWRIIDVDGFEVESGETCPCGRGCYDHDTIRDEWGYHDTCIERYRADVLYSPAHGVKSYMFACLAVLAALASIWWLCAIAEGTAGGVTGPLAMSGVCAWLARALARLADRGYVDV